MVQVPIANAALSLKMMLLAPAVAVTELPQLFTTAGVAATTKFVGSVSVKLASIGAVFGLVMLKVIVLEVVPVPAVVWIVVPLKLVAIEGGCKTIILAVIVC
jgi:hypothetical protein